MKKNRVDDSDKDNRPENELANNQALPNTRTDAQNNNFGKQDTFGEAEANQVSIQSKKKA